MNLRESAINRLASCVFAMLVAIGLFATGCQQSSDSTPAGLQSVPQHLVHQVGKVHFVSDPTTGFRLAAEKNLPCLLFFTAEWCTYCHDMQETAFTDAAVGNLAQGFVCVEIDGDRHEDVCRHYRVRGFPTVQFVAADGRALHRLVGRQTADSLATGMRAAQQRFAWLNGQSPTVL